MGFVSNVINKLKGGTRLLDAITGAFEDAKAERAAKYVLHLGAAMDLKNSDPPPMTAAELEALNERINRQPNILKQKKELMDSMSKTMQDSFLLVSLDQLNKDEKSGSVHYREVVKRLMNNIYAVRNVSDVTVSVMEAFSQLYHEILAQEKTGQITSYDASLQISALAEIKKMTEQGAMDIAWRNHQQNIMQTAEFSPTSVGSTVRELLTIEKEIPQITDGMQYLYNLRRNYEIFSQMMHEGLPLDQIKDTLKNSMCGGNEPADALDVRINFFVTEFEKNNGSRELSLRFMADRMSEFNTYVESTTTMKVANEMDVNPNRHFINEDRTSNFDVIRETIGVEAFQEIVGLYKKDKDLENALKQIELHKLFVFRDSDLVDTKKPLVDSKTGEIIRDANGNPRPKYVFSTTALFDNGLPSGIELRFDIDKDNKVALENVYFFGQVLDQKTFLQTPEIMQLVMCLPPAMRSQVEKNLVVVYDKDGTYHPGIDTDPKRNIYAQAANAVQQAMEKNFLVVFGGGSVDLTPKDALHEHNDLNTESKEDHDDLD